MSITLTPQHEAMVRQLVDRGRFHDVEQVVEEAMRLLQEREHRIDALRAKLQVGLESGDAIPYTPELMDEIEREAEEAFRRGEKPSADVCP